MEVFFIELSKEDQTPLYEQMYQQIRDDIVSGKLTKGQKLPSKRKLGDFLNVSQTTVEMAYDQLVAEGYITSEPRRGFFVEYVEELAPIPTEPTLETEQSTREQHSIQIDFSPGLIDTAQFPFATWRKYARDVIDSHERHLLQLGHPHGDLELREQIARYVYESRGVECTPDQIIVGSGTEQLMTLLFRILDESAVFALEDPGYLATHPMFQHDKRPVIHIPVDEDGMQVDRLNETEATIAYVTPSHQFPTGHVLSASRKAKLLNWAAEHSSRFIIEDDYDSEFRYIGKPIPSLQSMDPLGKVIYLSTFSKSFMPSLRMAYMILPIALLERYERAFIHYAATVPRFDQHLVARFMEDGHFARHLNRMRNLYKKKLHLIIDELEPYAPYVSYSGEHAGMHVTLSVQEERSEQQLVQRAQSSHIQIEPITAYCHTVTYEQPTFLLGFGGLPLEVIPFAIRRLFDSWSRY